jgi:hypothetical protein
MKRFLPSIPVFLLMLLNACDTTTTAISPDTGTAVAYTQTAAMWTPPPTSTPDPNESDIVDWLNEGLSKMDPLERTIDAHYQILDVSFLMGPTGPTIFRMDIRCECVSNTRCCVPERMFVITMDVMKRHGNNIIKEVPGNTVEVHLFCYNQQTLIGIMAARWADVKDHLQDKINGFQLGSRVYKIGVP